MRRTARRVLDFRGFAASPAASGTRWRSAPRNSGCASPNPARLSEQLFERQRRSAGVGFLRCLVEKCPHLGRVFRLPVETAHSESNHGLELPLHSQYQHHGPPCREDIDAAFRDNALLRYHSWLNAISFNKNDSARPTNPMTTSH